MVVSSRVLDLWQDQSPQVLKQDCGVPTGLRHKRAPGQGMCVQYYETGGKKFSHSLFSSQTTFGKGTRVKRLRYSEAHKDWNDGWWKRVLSSDESKFEILVSNHQQCLRERVGERWRKACLWLSVKYGAVSESVLLWGCSSASGVSDIVQNDGIVDAQSTDRF